VLWILVTIVLPLALPVIAMLFLAPFPPFSGTARWIVPIKDGQLCWGAIAMAFSGMYEALFPSQSGAVDGTFRGAMVIALALVVFFSALLAALGAVAPTAMPAPSGTPWRRHYVTLTRSAVITAIAAVIYTAIHFKGTPSRIAGAHGGSDGERSFRQPRGSERQDLSCRRDWGLCGPGCGDVGVVPALGT
jgi:hypothetical protein